MKLFVTDFDGTLFIDEMNLKINKKRLLELHNLGFIIIISTGRSFNSIKNQVEKFNLYYDYLHCADGSIIYDRDDKLINFYEMDHKIVKTLLSLKDKIIYDEIQISYPKNYENSYRENDKIAGINIVIKREFYSDDFVNEFMSLKEKFPNYNFLNYDHGNYIYLCVKKNNVSKAMGIKFMENYLNIKKDDIYVIGDSDNDLEMIKNYNGVGIKGNNENINKYATKLYHHVYEYIDEIKKDMYINN